MSRALGSRLREVYSDVLNEPVPPRFRELLDSMKGSERSNS
ncbi:NepR family anti-sigma factor [Hyphomonas sp.]